LVVPFCHIEIGSICFIIYSCFNNVGNPYPSSVSILAFKSSIMVCYSWIPFIMTLL
jgi:hypothetical protein